MTEQPLIAACCVTEPGCGSDVGGVKVLQIAKIFQIAGRNVCVHACMRVYACVCVCMRVCVHVCMCVCMYVHVCMFTPSDLRGEEGLRLGHQRTKNVDYGRWPRKLVLRDGSHQVHYRLRSVEIIVHFILSFSLTARFNEHTRINIYIYIYIYVYVYIYIYVCVCLPACVHSCA